jgi:H+/Cl- antiporter ClcA
MITALKVIFSALLIWVIYVVISTSLESSLIEQWSFLGSIPWMRATLWDFYANIFIITLWMFYKEKSIFPKIVWVILFVCLGSIATCSYILIKLFKLKQGDGVKELIGNKG